MSKRIVDSRSHAFLKGKFFNLASRHCKNTSVIYRNWKKIINAYSDKSRYYHNVSHLENMFDHLHLVRDKIKNWDAVLFALYYHDIIYDTHKSDNEKRSAEFAVKQMKNLCVPLEIINLCYDLIINTQSHQKQIDNDDSNYFIDSDLSILGQDIMYGSYCLFIRLEYQNFSDEVYNAGRIKVLQSFLNREHIFHTDYFHSKYENNARKNIEKELTILTHKQN